MIRGVLRGVNGDLEKNLEMTPLRCPPPVFGPPSCPSGPRGRFLPAALAEGAFLGYNYESIMGTRPRPGQAQSQNGQGKSRWPCRTS